MKDSRNEFEVRTSNDSLMSHVLFCRLSTAQLDKLAYVNANLRVLEKVGGLDGGGTISWTVKQVDHTKIIVKPADISQLQPHTDEDDVYDFIREDMMRFTLQTRSTTRRRAREASSSGVAAAVGRGGSATARGGRGRGRSTQRTSDSSRLTPTPSDCESESDASDSE